jgi:peptidoglycan/LPS O-acetylase OafA/YrhL
MFLSPAWSLSLEWQFYLVAPIVIWAARRKLPSIALAAVSLFLFFLYARNRLGWWALPSFLPGASLYFAVGIASRLIMTRKEFRFSWWAVAIMAIGFVALDGWLLPVEIWLVFLGTSLYQVRGGTFSGPVGRAFAWLFESRLAVHLGEASYSTYLVHFPLLQIAMYLGVKTLALTPTTATVFVALATLTSTYALSQLTYRFIERPFMARARRLGSKDLPSEAAAISPV